MKLYQREDCPFSQKVRGRLTELGLPYVNVNVPRPADERADLVRVSGQSATPVLVDDGHVVTGASAILEYLDGRGGLSGREPLATGQVKTFRDRPSYAMTRQLAGVDVPHAREAVQALLARNGFTVLAAIDLAGVLRTRAGVELDRPYLVLEVAHPALLASALASEPYAALLPPATIVITAEGADAVVSASRPVAAWAAIDDPRARDVGERMEALLLKVVTSL